MSKESLGATTKGTKYPMLDEEGRIILEPEAIIATWEKRLCSRVIKEYMIK